jgi:hypothetical protein
MVNDVAKKKKENFLKLTENNHMLASVALSS